MTYVGHLGDDRVTARWDGAWWEVKVTQPDGRVRAYRRHRPFAAALAGAGVPPDIRLEAERATPAELAQLELAFLRDAPTHVAPLAKRRTATDCPRRACYEICTARSCRCAPCACRDCEWRLALAGHGQTDLQADPIREAAQLMLDVA